jgi:hypothetical protein
MTTSTPDDTERRPTRGPDDGTYERYRFDRTTDGEALIYDKAVAGAWVQSTASVSLEAWR